MTGIAIAIAMLFLTTIALFVMSLDGDVKILKKNNQELEAKIRSLSKRVDTNQHHIHVNHENIKKVEHSWWCDIQTSLIEHKKADHKRRAK